MQTACHRSFSETHGLQAKRLAAHSTTATMPAENSHSTVQSLLPAVLGCSHDQYVLREKAKSAAQYAVKSHMSLDRW